MLEGLEISEINLSDVLKDNDNKRIDSEYFRKQFLNFFKNVPNLRPLSYFAKDGYRVVYETTHIVDKQEAIQKSYPFFLQATDLKTPFIDTSNLFHVHEEDWERYPKGRIVKGEILIEVKGKIEKVAIVPDDFPEKTLVTGSLFKLTVNDKISKHVMLSYLISKYGEAFKDRYKTNLLISFVSKPDLYRIPVPCFSAIFQLRIDELFKEIFSSNNKSQELYKRAETLLLETLCLNNFEPSTDGVNVKSYKDSFLATGRLDAEYYQKKYDETKAKVFKCAVERKYEIASLKDIACNPKYGSSEKLEYLESGVPFLRIADLEDKRFNRKNLKFISVEAAKEEASARVKTNDILISRSGTLGLSVLIQEDLNDSIYGSYFIKITPDIKKIDPKYLTFYLNSKIGQIQVEQENTGGIQTNLTIPVIESLYIIIPDKETMGKIVGLIEESFRLKKQSEQLLETAKRAVEIAIEQDEEAAMQYINNQSLLKN